MKRAPKTPKSSGWLYGKNPITEVLRAGRRKVFELGVSEEFQKNSKNADLLKLAQKAGANRRVMKPHELEKLSDGGVHQGVVAKAESYPYATLSDITKDDAETQLVLALDSVTDPQNLATLARSALAFGATALLLPKDRSAFVNPLVCKASSGAVEHLKIVQVVNLARSLEDLKSDGFWVYGTSLSEGCEPLPQVSPGAKSVLVMGSEGKGLRPLIEKTCDVLVQIPMATDFDSLNVAQAGTVCLYEFSKKGLSS